MLAHRSVVMGAISHHGGIFKNGLGSRPKLCTREKVLGNVTLRCDIDLIVDRVLVVL